MESTVIHVLKKSYSGITMASFSFEAKGGHGITPYWTTCTK